MNYGLKHYIMDAMAAAENRGDTYLPLDQLYSELVEEDVYPAETAAVLEELIAEHQLICCGNKLYLPTLWNAEYEAAQRLHTLLKQNDLQVPSGWRNIAMAGAAADGVTLEEEQESAIHMALSHRISIVSGGPGTGKTTMVRTLCNVFQSLYPMQGVLLCAPTGKASRVLEDRTHRPAYTIHSALLWRDDAIWEEAQSWIGKGLIIVDEASMLTNELLAGILRRIPDTGRLVLIGDRGQLPAVGAGDVLGSLSKLNVPETMLHYNHRQGTRNALQQNVVAFPEKYYKLHFDLSFCFHEVDSEKECQEEIREEYLNCLRNGEDVEILTPYKDTKLTSAGTINTALQEIINPPREGVCEAETKKRLFRDGDRVILTRNTRYNRNGDIGIVRIADGPNKQKLIVADFPHGQEQWPACGHDVDLELAYALTVHRAQGSEYGTVIIPILESASFMLDRNWFYTAISRAKKQVILVGQPSALQKAMSKFPEPRKTALAELTLQCA